MVLQGQQDSQVLLVLRVTWVHQVKPGSRDHRVLRVRKVLQEQLDSQDHKVCQARLGPLERPVNRERLVQREPRVLLVLRELQVIQDLLDLQVTMGRREHQV